VAEWWSNSVSDAGELVHGTHFLASLNDVLDARARQHHLAPTEKRALAELAGAALAV
jgi:hypothetical protein